MLVTLEEARLKVEQLRAEIADLKMDYHSVREMETLLNRVLIMIEQGSGSKEISQFINKIQRLITIIRLAQYSIHSFYVAAGPIGWALALSGLAMTAFTMTSTIAQEMEGH